MKNTPDKNTANSGRPRLVLVEWEDAYSRSTWVDDCDVETNFDDGGYDCVTVGYLIRENRHRIILAARGAFKNGPTYGLLQRIPRGMVRRVVDISEPLTKKRASRK